MKLTKKDKLERIWLVIIEEYAYNSNAGHIPIMEAYMTMHEHLPMHNKMQLKLTSKRKNLKIDIRLMI
jgi:hypothetical protein